MTFSPRICIAHPNPGPECETFIQALVDRLPSVCDVLYGGHMPCFDKHGNTLGETQPAIPPAFASDGIPVTSEQRGNAQALQNHLKKLRPDVVLAEYGPTGVAMHALCHDLGIPMVVKFHGYDCSVHETVAKYRVGYEAIFQRAHALITVSESQRKRLIDLGAPAEKVHVIPTGVDIHRFKPSCPGTMPPHFVSVGRFVEKKSPARLIEAFARVLKKVPDAHLTMIGDGILYADCVDLAASLKMGSAITFTGRIPHKEVAATLHDARCFVQHSVTPLSGDQEGTPNAILEASASGLPVVSTRHAGIPEAVLHEKTGLLCDENDIHTMAEHMIRMAQASQEASQLGAAGRAHMKRKYDMNMLVNELHAILQQAYADTIQ